MGRTNVNATTEIVEPRIPISRPIPGVTTTWK